MSNSLIPPLFPEQPDFNYVWKESAKYNPAQEQKVQSLSSVMDADEADIRENFLEYESLFAEKQLYNDTVARTYPTLYKNLTSVPFVATARDDMGNIIETEGWWNEISNAYNVARDTVAIGSIGTRAMLEGRDLYPYERRKIEQARKLQQAHMQSEPGWLAAAAELAGTMQETLGYSLAAGKTAAMVSGPAAGVTAPIAAGIAAFATSLNLEGGNLYADLVMDGYTPAQAADIASSYGAVIAGFESVGLKFAGAPFKQLAKEIAKKRGKGLLLFRKKAGEISGGILADYAKGITAESLTEGVQEVLGEFAQLRASQLYRPDNLYEPEYYEAFSQAFTHTFKGMVIMGGVPSAIRLANDNIKAANANHDYKKEKEAAEIRGRSKAPEAQRQVDAEAGETSAYNSSYYVRAQDFKNAIAEGVKEGVVTEDQVRDTIEANSPGLMARIDEAAERDGEVELTKTEFEDAFDNTLLRETALSNTAFQENGMTKREYDEVDRLREKMVKERGEEAAKDLQDMENFERELREVRQEVRRDLEKVLKGTDAELTMNAAANASLLIGFIRRAALQRNVSPREFVEKHLPEIVRKRLEGQQAQQQTEQTEQQTAPAADPVIEVVEAAPEMAEAMTEANEAPVTRVTPVVASAATENPQRQAADPEPAAEPEVEVTPEVEPEVTEEAAPEPAAEPKTDEKPLFEGDATPEQIAKFESLLPARNAQGLFDLSNEARLPRTGRFVKMQEALMAMDRGEITREQRDALADILKPVLADDQVYDAPTNEEMSNALKPKQVALLNQKLEAGRRVGVRLDIPSTKKGARTIAVHDVGAKSKKAKGYQRGGKEVSYTNVARLSNVEMVMHQETAKAVALGENKDKLGVIYGDWMPTSVEEATKIAQEALTDPAWRQVGIDPERHGYYYDRKTGEPLVSADEVVQVGSQVFAKNAKVAGKEQFLYSKESEAPRPNVVRAYHGTAGRFEDFNKAVRDALAKWDVVRKKLQADIDKAKAEHEKSREAERKLREETNQQLESDLAKLEQERKALEDDGSQSFYEKRKEIFRRRDRLKSEAYQTVRNSPETKALRKTLKSLEEARDAYQEAKSQTSPPDRYLRRRDIVKTPRAKVDRRTGEKSVVYDTKREGPLVVNEEMLSDFFNEKHIGSTDYGYGPQGIYFTEDQGQAKEYSQPAFSGRDRIPGYKPKPYVYTVDIDTSQFYDYRNPVTEIEEAINEKFDVEFKQLQRQRGGPETFEAGVARAKREVLEAAGYKGMIFRMKDSAGSPGFSKTGEEIVVFDTSVIQEVSSPDGVLFSRTGEGDQQRVLGQAEVMGGDTITKILLDPNAKPTTLMHELMHWNLELMAEIGLDIEAKLAQEGYEATALEKQMLSDIKELLKWSGFEGTLTEWRAMTIDQRREFHEVIAMSFERYLYEGVAPSRELRGVFSRLLSYISGKFEALVKDFQKTYNAIRKEQGKPEQPLPGLNDEVRAIFGRMMSAERDVQAFFDERELEAMMMTKDEWIKSGRDAQEYDEYEEEFKDSIYEAKAEMTQQRMKEAKTFANAYALVAQKQRVELQRITKQIREEVEAQTKMESVYQFLDWMRKKPYQTEKGPYTDSRDFTSRKLNGDIVKAKAPALYEELKRRNLISKDGMSLESVRDMFGFESTDAMLEALATHRNFKEEVLHRTNQRLLNEHTDLMDPIVQQENVHAAVHNKIRQKVMARELKFLLQNGRRSKVELELAKQVAIALIEKTPTGRIDVAAYSRAAARARKKAIKALKDGDIEAARFAKRQELVNEQMVVEGLKARKEVRSLVESNKRAFKHRSDSALAKAGYDVTVMKALRAILSRLGIGNVDFDPNEALARFAKEDPEFAAEVGDNIMALLRKDIAQPRVGDRRKPMEHLTLGDIRVLRLLSARMMLRAKNKLTTKIGEKKQRIEAAQEEAAATLESNVKDGNKDLDGKKSIFGKIRNYFADLIRFEHLFRRADANKVGIWTRMFRMVKDAGNRYREEVKEFTQNFGDRLRALDLTLPGGNRELEMTVLGETIIIGQNGRNVKSQLIHLAMHYYGNASNRERLVRGYAGREANDEQMRQADREVKAFLQEQVRQGVLTRKDFEFMQETFKQLNGSDMLGRAQDVMLRLRHYEMNTIKAEKFSIEFPDGAVEFTGGYIPVRYDRSEGGRADAQGLQDEDMSIDQQAKRMLSILPSFAKDRTGPEGDPLELNLANIQHHAAEVFRFIHMAEPVTEVYKVVSGRKVQRTFIRKFGTKAYRNMEGWLRRSAYQKMDRDEDTQVGNMMLAMSRNANKGVMFLNIGNALQNYAGLVIPMRRVGARRIISALMSNMFSKGPRIEAMEKSTELRLRVDRQIFDIYNQQNQLLTQESGVWDKISNWSNRYAYFLQQWTQNHVDVAVWQAAYNQETERALQEFMGDPEGAAKAEARAVAYADSVVRQTQMAGEKEDLSHFESQGSIYRAMFPFKSWFINWMNNAENQRRLDLNKEGQAKAAALASSYMYLLMLPAMLALAATELARGEDFDDEDDGYGDDMWELWWRSQAEQVVGGLPVAVEVTRMIDSFWLDDQYWNNRYPATPWQRVLENIIKAPMKKDAVDATASVASQLADLFGVPATRVWNSVNLLFDEIAGELESESTYDFVRGAVTGKRSDLQRLSQ